MNDTAQAPTTATRENWLAQRSTGLGASDSAAALGVSPYKSRFQLWAEKSGVGEPENLDGLEYVEWGLRLERPIAEAFAERTGRDVSLRAPFTVVRHPAIPWLICTPDAEDDTGRIVQIKTCNAFAAKDWDAEPPLPYQVQLQHEMEVTGADRGTLVVLIGGQKLKWFDCDRNDRFITAMVEQLSAFWHLVETRTPPPVDASFATREALSRLYPADQGGEVWLPEEFAQIDEELQAAKAQRKAAEDQIAYCENRIKAAIGENTFGILPDGSRYSWKSQQRKGYTVEAGECRVLRRLK